MTGFLVSFVSILFSVLFYAILGRVLLSWVDPQSNFPVTRFLHEITEPILGPIRSIMPNFGMFDLSPIVAMLVLQLLERLIIGAIR
ncbi:MAG: YggT family protein [Chloroflexus sp.]